MGTAEPTGTRRAIGIAEGIVIGPDEETVVTYGLGSCLGVTFHDPAVGVSAMIHTMLPLSSSDRSRAQRHPYTFVDSGVLAVLGEMFERGARADRLIVKAAGAATSLDENGLFRIGERNHAVLRRILWKNGIMISAEDVGGALSRTLLLEPDTGRTLVKKNGVCRVL